MNIGGARTILLAVLLAFAATSLRAEDAETAAPAYTPVPIPCGAEAFSSAKLTQQFLAFNQRNLRDAYRQYGERNAAWDDDMDVFLDGMAAYYAGTTNAPARATLRRQVDQLFEKGCRDPLAYYCRGTLRMDDGAIQEAKQSFLQAAVRLEKTPYPPIRTCFLARNLVEIYKMNRFVNQSACASWQTRLAKWIPVALTNGTYRAGEERLAAAHLNLFWAYRFDCGPGADAVMKSIRETPGVDPWLVELREGIHEINRAWTVRGGGWAFKVTEEGWAGYKEHLGKAREHLAKAWSIHPEYPEAASTMIEVVMGGGGATGETERLWFDRAVAAQFDYEPAYNALFWALRPRWGGSHQAMYDLGLECLKTGRYDTSIPWHFFQALCDIDQDLEGKSTWWREPGTFLALQRMFEGYLANDDSPARSANRTAYALAAWKCGNYVKASQLWASYSGDLREDTARQYFGVGLAEVEQDLAIRTSPLTDDLDKAEALLTAGNWTDARHAFEQLVERAADQAQVLARIRERLFELDQRDRFMKGEVVPLAVGTGFEGWEQVAGTWTVDSRQRLHGVSTVKGLLLMTHMAFPPPLRVKMDGEFVRSNYRQKFNLGVYWVDAERPTSEASYVDIYRDEHSARLREEMETKELWFPSMPVLPRNTLELALRGQACSVHLNGEKVCEEHRLLDGWKAGGLRIGVGGSYWYDDTEILIHSVEIQRLAPKAETSDNAKP